MDFKLLPSGLRKYAESANSVIKRTYGLQDGIVEKSIEIDIGIQPTLHWKTKTEYIACEVRERPISEAIKNQFAKIIASGQPIRIIVAYPKNNGLSLTSYKNDIKDCKSFGIGYMEVEDNGRSGTIEYQGISLALHIAPIDLSRFKTILKPSITEAYEHYMLKGDPKVGLQKIGQLTEDIIYNIAVQAKKNGKFNYPKFKPPKFINQSELIDHMIAEKVMDIPILGRCKDFGIDRNGVSHIPKTITDAIKIERKLKENFIIGTRILEDIPDKIKKSGYRLHL